MSAGAPRGRVLVVDDQFDICQVLNVLLSLEGYEVSMVFGVEEALEYVSKTTPDVILLDYMMPGSRPDKLVAAIRDTRTEVILMSAHPNCAELARLLKIRFWTVKPFDVDRLIELVHHCSTVAKSKEIAAPSAAPVLTSGVITMPNVGQSAKVRSSTKLKQVETAQRGVSVEE